MATVHKIEAEISKAFGIKRKAGEKDAKFFKRLHAAATEEGDEAEKKWDSLSESAQAWVNGCTDAIEADEEFPEFDAVEVKAGKKSKAKDKADAESKSDDDDEDGDEGEKPTKKGAKKSDKKPAVKREGNKLALIQQIVLDNPEDGPDEIVKKVHKQKKDISKHTIVAIRGAFIRAVNFMYSDGTPPKKNPFA